MFYDGTFMQGIKSTDPSKACLYLEGATNQKAAVIQFGLSTGKAAGGIYADGSYVGPGGVTLNAAGLSIGSAPVQAVGATGYTIAVGTAGKIPITVAAAATGAILAPGMADGQVIKIVNRSANSVTFAASGTSNVADGVSDVIAANSAASYTWDAGTALWYRG